METDGSSSCSQQPDNCSLSQPYKSSPFSHFFQFLKIQFYIILYQTHFPFHPFLFFLFSVGPGG
jgi:hypothetical protein